MPQGDHMKTTIMRAGAKAHRKKGLIIVNTGNGKGKTTAALGVALRACGYGMKVIMLQFFKGKWKYGELRSAPKLETFEICPMGQGFTWESKDIEVDKAMVRAAWQAAKEKILSGGYDLVVLDEINYALSYEFLPVEDVVEFLKNKPPMLHVILTGRDAKPGIVEIADLVTEMREIKHPFQQGIVAQKGIEF
ncbi:MAG: cob(I)yrinic acid a,c-diamide adenosyltransferase [Acidobacteriota bacterium]|nr:cob(I)yrinic acid a,c-diamide adenosyltransferase [Acidobacteriota bacterium]